MQFFELWRLHWQQLCKKLQQLKAFIIITAVAFWVYTPMLIVYRAKAFHLSCRFNRLPCRSKGGGRVVLGRSSNHICWKTPPHITHMQTDFNSPRWSLKSTLATVCYSEQPRDEEKNPHFRKQSTSPRQRSTTNSLSLLLIWKENWISCVIWGSATLWNEGRVLSQRWRVNYTNKLLWDKQNGVMSEALQLVHAEVNCSELKCISG